MTEKITEVLITGEETPGQKFERAFLQVVLDRVEKRVGTYRALAKRAWPNITNPERRLHAMRRWGRLGKPQHIRLADAYDLSRALNVDITKLIILAEIQAPQEVRALPPPE